MCSFFLPGEEDIYRFGGKALRKINIKIFSNHKIFGASNSKPVCHEIIIQKRNFAFPLLLFTDALHLQAISGEASYRSRQKRPFCSAPSDLIQSNLQSTEEMTEHRWANEYHWLFSPSYCLPPVWSTALPLPIWRLRSHRALCYLFRCAESAAVMTLSIAVLSNL